MKICRVAPLARIGPSFFPVSAVRGFNPQLNRNFCHFAVRIASSSTASTPASWQRSTNRPAVGPRAFPAVLAGALSALRPAALPTAPPAYGPTKIRGGDVHSTLPGPPLCAPIYNTPVSTFSGPKWRPHVSSQRTPFCRESTAVHGPRSRSEERRGGKEGGERRGAEQGEEQSS